MCWRYIRYEIWMQNVYKWYYSNEKCHGFGIRKDDVGYGHKGEIVMPQFLCNKARLRDKKYWTTDNPKRRIINDLHTQIV